MIFNRLLIVRETWSHMSSVSGFDGLAQTLIENRPEKFISLFVDDYRNITWGFKLRILNRLNNLKSTNLFTKKQLPYVTLRHQNIAIEIISKLKKDRSLFVLLTATENQFSKQFASLKNEYKQRIVVVLHQPPSWFKKNKIDFSLFDNLKAIITLGCEQKKYISKYTATHVIGLKHGVNTEFFRPPTSRICKKNHQILFVGQWLRDFNTFIKCIKILSYFDPNLKFHCVIPDFAQNEHFLEELFNNTSVIIYSSISENDLLKLYQESMLLLLPLQDAVANNAILESLSCGLPIVTSDVGDVRDYLPRNCNFVCKSGDAEDHANAVISLLKNENLIIETELLNRQYANTNLNWSQISKDLISRLEL